MLHPQDLGLLFPLFSDVVIDVQDTFQLTLIVEERDTILLKDVGAGRELNRHFTVNLLFLGEHLPDPLTLLFVDLEVAEGHRGDT